jgi:hypothetical protein
MSEREANTGRGTCAWCATGLPEPAKVLVIRHPADGTPVKACSARCLAEWIQHGSATSRDGGSR